MNQFPLYTAFSSRWCPHCDRAGFILMDDIQRLSVAEPCPMCPAGRSFSARYSVGAASQFRPPKDTDAKAYVPIDPVPMHAPLNRDGRTVPQPDYYHQVDIAALSWSNGLTIRHRWICDKHGCFQPVTRPSVLCDGCLPQEARVSA